MTRDERVALRRAQRNANRPDARACPWGDTPGRTGADFALPTRPPEVDTTTKLTRERRARARRLVKAQENKGGTGETVEWVNGRTRIRKMAQKNAHLDGTTCPHVEPIQAAQAASLPSARVSFNDAQQHFGK